MAEEQGRRRHAEGGPRPGLSPAHGRAREAAGRVQDPGGARQGRQEAPRHGGDAHRADRARAGRRSTATSPSSRARRRPPSSASRWRRRASPARTPSSASTPPACCPAFERRAPSSASSPTPSASRIAAAALLAALQRHVRRRRDQAEGARHRLRSQAGDRGRRRAVRAATPAPRRSTPTASAATSWPRSARPTPCSALRPQVPAGQRPAEPANRRAAHQDQLRGHEPRRQGAPLRRHLERLPGRQPARLSGARHRHRHRHPDLHVRPVRRQRRALAAVRRAEHARPAARQQLEAIIENALLPDTFDNARATLNAMRPITKRPASWPRCARSCSSPHTERQVLDVLNAGATIGAVDYDEAAGHYLVRAELYEFLAIVAKRSFEADKANVDLAELEKLVGVALLPDINRNAETVLHYMHPIDEDRGFTAEINLAEVEPDHKRTVRSTLNAAATLGRVQRAGRNAGYFYHPPRSLQDAGAHPCPHADGRLRPARASRERQAPGERFGGSITERAKADRAQAGHLRATTQTTTEIRGGFVTQLLAALNIDPKAWERVSASPTHRRHRGQRGVRPRAPRQHAARCAARQARRTRRAVPSTRRTRRLKGKLKPQASWELQMLSDAYQELDQHWAVLMLLPNGPYELVLRDLVERPRGRRGCRPPVERAAGALRHLARSLADTFQGNARTNEASWRPARGRLHRRAARRATRRRRQRAPDPELTLATSPFTRRPALPASNAGRSLFWAMAPTPFRHRPSPLPPRASIRLLPHCR